MKLYDKVVHNNELCLISVIPLEMIWLSGHPRLDLPGVGSRRLRTSDEKYGHLLYLKVKTALY